jgi:hypothetical protein
LLLSSLRRVAKHSENSEGYNFDVYSSVVENLLYKLCRCEEQSEIQINHNGVGALLQFLTTDLTVIHRTLQRLVCPILRADERGRAEFAGSAVLFKVDSMHFLFTAAHVLDDPDHAPYVYGRTLEGRTQFVDLEGERIDTVPPPKGREHDHVDAAVFRLSGDAADGIGCNHPFLGPEDLDIAGFSSSEDHFAFIGYPQRRFRRRPENKTKFAGAMFRLSGAPENKYQELELDSSTHIIANYDPTNLVDSDGKQMTPPTPFGISGGGIWTLKTKQSESVGFHDPKLAGIAIEWRRQHKVMVGVRVNVLVALMAVAFPSTREFFPADDK